jgi:hypothetical protein
MYKSAFAARSFHSTTRFAPGSISLQASMRMNADVRCAHNSLLIGKYISIRHCTAGTNIATQVNGKGYMNSAALLFILALHCP